MTKLRALIIDDEPLAHRVILEYAKDVPFLEITGQCYLATEALAVLNTQKIDLLFLDIQMPKLKGLDFLKTLPQRPAVIITSAYQEYALQGFELDVCDYLLKPFRFERFLKALNKALAYHQLTQMPHTPPSIPIEPASEEPGQLFIKVDKRHLQIGLAAIYFLESYGNYVKVWMKEVFHLTPRTLSSFEAELPQTDFLRIHKSFIVNRKQIQYLEGNRLRLNNEKELPIGKNYRQIVKDIIL